MQRYLLLDILIHGPAGVPKTVVETAVEKKKEAARSAKKGSDSFLKFDHVWCVFDVDDHPHLVQATQQANDNGVNVAISNPSFELWILLHFESQRAHIHRGDLRSKLQIHIPDYDKVAPFNVLWPLYDVALNNARDLEQWQAEQGRPRENPSTGVFHLTELILDLARNAQPRF